METALAFDIGLYSYYRGSILTPYHPGPVSPTEHHLTLTNGVLLPDGGMHFVLALDGGSPDTPAHVMAFDLDVDGHVVEHWDTVAVAGLPASSIRNTFDYNRVATGPYGLTAHMGATATLVLPPPAGSIQVPSGHATVNVTDVDGHRFSTALQR